MKVVTFATKDEGYFNALKESAVRYSVDLVVLGWGEEWQGFGHKIRAVMKYLSHVDDKEIIVFIDGYDVILLNDMKKLEKEYEDYSRLNGDKVVISTVVSGFSKQFMNAAFGKCGDHNLNSGTYIGRAYVLRKVFSGMCANRACEDPKADDQRLLTKFCDRHRNLFDFDVNNRWFLVWGLLDNHVDNKVEFKDGKLLYQGHSPYVLHCPGNKDMTGILKSLGYNVDETSKRSVISYYRKIYKNHIRWAIGTYGWLIILVVFISMWFVYGS